MSLITTVTTQDPDRQIAWLCICVTTSMQIYDLTVSWASSELTFIGSKYVSVYMHLVEVSVSLVTKWTPPGGVD